MGDMRPKRPLFPDFLIPDGLFFQKKRIACCLALSLEGLKGRG